MLKYLIHPNLQPTKYYQTSENQHKQHIQRRPNHTPNAEKLCIQEEIQEKTKPKQASTTSAHNDFQQIHGKQQNKQSPTKLKTDEQ